MSRRYEAALRVQRLLEHKRFTRKYHGELSDARRELESLIAKSNPTAQDGERFAQLQERLSVLMQ